MDKSKETTLDTFEFNSDTPEFNDTTSEFNNDTVTANDIVDLTSDHESFYDQYREITVESRSALSINFLKTLYAENPKTRIKVQNSVTYIILNQAKTDNEQFIVNEWYFKDMAAVKSLTVNIPLSARLVQTKLKGSGSVGSGFSVGVSLKGTKKSTKVYGISITVGTRWLHSQNNQIPALGITPTLQFTKSESESFKLSDSLSVSASCSAENGHSVSQYLRVGLTKFGNIKIRQLSFDYKSQKWHTGHWETIEEDFNPVASIACFAEEQPLDPELEIDI